MLKHTLTPRVKAFHIAMEIMRDDLDAVYDITVAYEGTLDGSGQRRPAPSMAGRFEAPSEVSYQELNIR